MAAAGFAFVIWWKWPEFRKRPFVAKIIDRSKPAALPAADPSRFTVAIAHLEHDPQQEHENLIFQGLNEGFSGEDKNAVQILRFDRTIEISDPTDLEPVVAAGHETARSYLTESGAEVLIWGTVVEGGEESVPKLYWTTAREGDRPRNPGRYATEDLALPQIFWEDLVDILRLLVVTRDAEFRSLDGHFVADRLGPFINKVRSLLTGGGQGWTNETLPQVQLILATSLSTVGEQAGRNEALVEAIAQYRELLSHYTREKVPLDWAMTQNNLGNALSRLGQRESGTERLEQAVEAFRAALEERTQEKVPLAWATTQNNLGTTLRTLGERRKDDTQVCDALGAHLAGWEVFSDAGASYYTAMAKNGIKSDLAVLKDVAEATEYEQCLDQHRTALNLALGGGD